MIIFILDIKFSLSLSDDYFDYCYLNHGVFDNKTNQLKKISIYINTHHLHIHIQVMLFFQDLIVYVNHYPVLLGYNFSSLSPYKINFTFRSLYSSFIQNQLSLKLAKNGHSLL